MGRVRSWSLQVRLDCQGPVLEASGLPVGTFLYCVASGSERAWVTLVGLPAGERFGLPGILSVDGGPHVAVVKPAPYEESKPVAAPLEPSQGATEDLAADVAPEATDAGAMAPAPIP